MARVARLLVCSIAGFAVLLATTGWMYLLEARGGSSAFGPSIGDALPLDELSKHSAVPLSTFVIVWAAAAILLGLIARLARAERMTAALLLALAVAVWGYLETGVSLLIVRQVPAHDAFRAASQLQAIYMPAALAGL